MRLSVAHHHHFGWQHRKRLTGRGTNGEGRQSGAPEKVNHVSKKRASLPIKPSFVKAHAAAFASAQHKAGGRHWAVSPHIAKGMTRLNCSPSNFAGMIG